jgi:hypothetical protein
VILDSGNTLCSDDLIRSANFTNSKGLKKAEMGTKWIGHFKVTFFIVGLK